MTLPLAVTFYELSLFVHVTAAVVAFGPTFAFPVIQATAEKRYPQALPFALRAIDRVAKGIVTPVAVLVGVTGVYQVVDGPFKLGDARWLDTGFALYLLALAASLWVYRSSVVDSAVQAAERMVQGKPPGEPVELSDEYRRIMRVPNATGPILSVVLLVILFLMVVKP